MEVQILSRKLISPSSQNHPNNIKLSLFDQVAEVVYFKFIIFYETNDATKDTIPRLERSLSEALTIFYPLAGRYVEEGFSVECNGRGVEFLVAQVRNVLVSRILREPDPEALSGFVPCLSEYSPTAPLVSVQANVLECGGLALGFAVSHVLCDAYTFTLFLKTWASACRSGSVHETLTITSPENPPNFNVASIFPPRDHNPPPKPTISNPSTTFVTKRFAFDARAISTLKSTCTSTSSSTAPSRVQAITALIWRALITSKPPEHPEKPSLASHSINLRPRAETLIKNPCGNFCGKALARFERTRNDDPVELHVLAEAVRASLELPSVEGGGEAAEVYHFTSWCRMGHYGVDFGWGSPEWVSSVSVDVDGLVVLMDMKDGEGVEAWVSLEKDKMSLFEQDCLLLYYKCH